MKLVLISLIASSLSFAHGNQAHSQFGDGNNINNCNPVLKCRSRVVFVGKQQVSELEAKIDALQKEKEALLIHLHNQKSIVKHVYIQEENRKNAISLLGAVSQTKLVTSQDATSYTAKTEAELDVGLMYQHDFGSLRGSIAATLNGTGMLGLGLNF